MSLPFAYTPRPGEEITISRDAEGRCVIAVTSGTRTSSVRCLAVEAPGFAVMAARAICEAAGRPEPVILDRLDWEDCHQDETAGIRTYLATGNLVGVDGSDDISPGDALWLAARIASLAAEAKRAAAEPDPAEVEELTRILRRIAPGMADPAGGDYKTAVVRPFAEAALRYMRDKRQRGGERP